MCPAYVLLYTPGPVPTHGMEWPRMTAMEDNTMCIDIARSELNCGIPLIGREQITSGVKPMLSTKLEDVVLQPWPWSYLCRPGSGSRHLSKYLATFARMLEQLCASCALPKACALIQRLIPPAVPCQAGPSAPDRQHCSRQSCPAACRPVIKPLSSGGGAVWSTTHQ